MRLALHKGETHADVAMSYGALAAVYKRKQRYKEAEEHYRKAFEIFRNLAGSNDKRTQRVKKNLNEVRQLLATQCDNAAKACLKKQDAKQALVHYQEALQRRKAIHGEQPHASMATSLNNLGRIYKKQAQYNKALAYYGQALNMHLALHKGEAHPDVAMSYGSIGAALKNQEAYAKAEAYLHKSFEMFERCGKADSKASQIVKQHLDEVRKTLIVLSVVYFNALHTFTTNSTPRYTAQDEKRE